MAKKSESIVPQYLILGASGTLGSAIHRECMEQEVQVIAKTYEALDVTDLEEVRRQMKLLNPAMVVNCAAYTDVMGAEADRLECWNVNVRAVDNIIKVCLSENIPLIQFSDSVVFGDVLGNRLRAETDPLCPQGVYATTKAVSETALLGMGQMLCPEFWSRGFRYWLIRTSHLFGPANVNRHRNRAADMVNFACKAADDYPVASDVHRTITYAPHLAKSVIWLMQHYQEVVSGVYHIANDGYASLYQHFSNLNGLNEKINPRFRPASRSEVAQMSDFQPDLMPYYSGLNCDKWHEIAPWKMPSAEQAMQEFADSLAAN
jgi:dTDP-4-dehydrorhamnose reductase